MGFIVLHNMFRILIVINLIKVKKILFKFNNLYNKIFFRILPIKITNSKFLTKNKGVKIFKLLTIIYKQYSIALVKY